MIADPRRNGDARELLATVDGSDGRGEEGCVTSTSPLHSAHAVLVFVRHGESTGNERGVFSGWRDLALTERGRMQSAAAGCALSQRGIEFTSVFTSELRRAVDTCELLLSAMGRGDMARTRSWRLNERHCGAMHGLDKQQCKDLWGDELARTYRRSWEQGPPPAVAGSVDDPRIDARYRGVTEPLPLTESMGQMSSRVMIAWEQLVRPSLTAGSRVLVVGHGMALRALGRPVEGLTAPALPEWKLASAAPRVYCLDAQLRPLSIESIDNGHSMPDE